MLNALGKYLRKMRIDNGELLKEMADKLEMSSSMLSSIENSKRKAPNDFVERFERAYNLTAKQLEDLTQAFAESVESVAINVKGLSNKDQSLAFSFARRFSDLDEESKKNIMDILRKGRDE